MEEAVSDINKGILVQVGVSDPVRAHVVVVQRDIVVGLVLVLRHGSGSGLLCSHCTNNQLILG